MKLTPLTIALLLLSSVLCGQSTKLSPVDVLRENAVAINDLTKLDQKIYDVISEYEVIMIGEMHGTNEPADFAVGISQLIANNEGGVIIALELPNDLLGDLPYPLTQSRLLQSAYFQMENIDGRSGQAWFDLILYAANDSRITLESIDNSLTSPRDSSMYLDMVRIKKTYPNTKIITLTGNIHNWLKPFRDHTTLGGYLLKDEDHFSASKIMSINHLYKEGTMMNNTGNGLELRTITGEDNILNQTIKSDMYLVQQIFEQQDQYTHILYTEKVTHSEPVATAENK